MKDQPEDFRTFPALIAQHRPLSRSFRCRPGVPTEVSKRFGLRHYDFYALGAVGIQTSSSDASVIKRVNREAGPTR